MNEHVSDAEEIAASRETPERFAAIFDRHYAAVQGYLRRRVGRSLADDLAAETFVIAFHRRAAYDCAHANARPWLLGIAVNLLRRHRRTERRALRAYARTAVDPLRPRADDDDAGNVDQAISAELARALYSLSRGDREVLFLYAVADLSYDEISRALDIPTGTVRSRLARARRRVRELLDTDRAIPGQATIHSESS